MSNIDNVICSSIEPRPFHDDSISIVKLSRAITSTPRLNKKSTFTKEDTQKEKGLEPTKILVAERTTDIPHDKSSNSEHRLIEKIKNDLIIQKLLKDRNELLLEGEKQMKKLRSMNRPDAIDLYRNLEREIISNRLAKPQIGPIEESLSFRNIIEPVSRERQEKLLQEKQGLEAEASNFHESGLQEIDIEKSSQSLIVQESSNLKYSRPKEGPNLFVSKIDPPYISNVIRIDNSNSEDRHSSNSLKPRLKSKKSSLQLFVDCYSIDSDNHNDSETLSCISIKGSKKNQTKTHNNVSVQGDEHALSMNPYSYEEKDAANSTIDDITSEDFRCYINEHFDEPKTVFPHVQFADPMLEEKKKPLQLLTLNLTAPFTAFKRHCLNKFMN